MLAPKSQPHPPTTPTTPPTHPRNINNPALQAERFVLLSDKSNLFYQAHTGLRSRTVRCQ